MGWNKQINQGGDTLADLAVDYLERMTEALEEIAELLKPRILVHGLSKEELEEAIKPDSSLRRILKERQ